MHHLRRPAAVAAAVLCPVCLVAPCAAEAIFTDQAAATGLEFHHFNGMSGELYFPEMMGAGGALLDYDGDGDLDAYLVQGAMLGKGKGRGQAIFPPEPGEPPGDRLFRNDFGLDAAGQARVRFVDVTGAAGIAAGGYGMGVTTGDLDGDGWTDLYVTNLGPNQLLRNAGDGSFADVTTASGGTPLIPRMTFLRGGESASAPPRRQCLFTSMPRSVLSCFYRVSLFGSSGIRVG